MLKYFIFYCNCLCVNVLYRICLKIKKVDVLFVEKMCLYIILEVYDFKNK